MEGGEDEDESESEVSDDNDDMSDLSDVEEEMAADQDAKAKSSSGKHKGPGRRKANADDSELQSMKTGDFWENGSAGDETCAAFSIGNDSEIPVLSFTPPDQVVKRITTTIKPDGTQIIEVKYILKKSEVKRVQRESSKRSSTASSLDYLCAEGGGVRKRRGGGGDDDAPSLFQEEAGEENSLRIKFGRMKNKVCGCDVMDSRSIHGSMV